MKDEIIGVVPVVLLSSNIIVGTHERIASGAVGETEVYQVFHNYYKVFVRFPNQNDDYNTIGIDLQTLVEAAYKKRKKLLKKINQNPKG